MTASIDLHSIRAKIMNSKRITFGICEYRDAENRSLPALRQRDTDESPHEEPFAIGNGPRATWFTSSMSAVVESYSTSVVSPQHENVRIWAFTFGLLEERKRRVNSLSM
jgi:hypothetical protein